VKVRVLVVSAVAALVVVYLLRILGGSEAVDRPAERARLPRAVRGASELAGVAALSPRNVFEYSDGAIRATAPVTNAAAVAPRPAPSIPPQPHPSPLVRLVGLLRRGAQTRAALAIAGDTIVLAAGESASGYTVVSIDEDEGVRLRTPDGSTIVLVAAPER
jgi:hypothetical protein